MRFFIAGLALMMVGAQARAACDPVPPTWHLGEPKDASQLPDPPASIHNPYADDLRVLKAALQPGEKIFPYSGFVSYNGQAGGTSGYAIIRNGCVVKTLIIEAI